MPTYEMVVHLSAELEGTTPESAATDFARRLRGAVDPAASVLGLAVWRPWDGATRTPLPAPLPQQLREFFAGVEGSAALAEAAFRVRVGEIMADGVAEDWPVDRPDVPGGIGAMAQEAEIR